MKKKCKVENCNRPHHGLGFCKRHYNQFKRNGRIIDDDDKIIKTCKIDGCNGKYYAKDYCKRHYNQIKKYGYITNASNRTIFNLNEIIKYDNYAEIILYDNQCNEVARTIIDLEDIDKCKIYKWHLSNGYVYNDKIGRLHRFIMNPSDDMVVDHINRNPLDNKKCNLRVCTQQQNTMNNSLQSNNSSGFSGVMFCNRDNKWIASIGFNGKNKRKNFSNKSDAIRCRIALEIKYYKEYMSHYQILADTLENSLEYDIDDILSLEDLELIQDVVNNIFTDNVLRELGLLEEDNEE